MKAKNYKSITEILKKKYNKNFYDFEDFEDVLIKIRKVGN
jgi:2-hydroxy-3-keto-5-methylthiopentenyl-1-phosphate phosphatase